MSKAKNDVMAMIDRRRRNNRQYKKKNAKRVGPEGIVAQFIQSMDELTHSADTITDFQSALEKEVNQLFSRMKCIDPEVDLEIHWNKEDAAEKWQDLQVEGVMIKWSKFHLGKHPFKDAEKWIDIGTLFIEGYLADDSSEDEPV